MSDNMKTRKKKASEYEDKYSNIPRDFYERINWICDTYNIKENKYEDIIAKKNRMIDSMYYSIYKVILYEEPEGSPRPRFRLVNRNSLMQQAMSNSFFVHVYSITGAEDNKFMNRLVTEQDLMPLNQLICTPCNIVFDAFIKTPRKYNSRGVILHSSIGKPLYEIIMISPDHIPASKKSISSGIVESNRLQNNEPLR